MVAIEVQDLDSPFTAVVLSAAFQLFGAGDPVVVVLSLAGVDQPTEEDGRAVQGLCLQLASRGASLPEILLLGEIESGRRPARARIRAGHDPAEAARAVVLLGATAAAVWEAAEHGSPQAPRPTMAVETPTRLKEDRLIAHRDARSHHTLANQERQPMVVMIFQQPSVWGAVATLFEALSQRKEIALEIVALDNIATGRQQKTGAFLADRGIAARTPAWLLSNLESVDVVVFDNPYDELRPDGLQVSQLVAAGIRVVAVPYGCNAIGGGFMDFLLWDMPLQRYAWRAYLGSSTQRTLFAEHCAAGSSQVRVLGSPKQDRIVRSVLSLKAKRWRALAAGRPLILWNPHFRIGAGGWSTFNTMVSPMLERFKNDTSAVLLIRPHFRLFPDLRTMGHAGERLERDVRRVVGTHANILLDESPDYLDALLACDAMLSDLSSLAMELLPSGKPILYLHREDGPGVNAEGVYFDAMDRAETFPDVARFLDRIERGEDPLARQRAAASRAAFPLADGHAGERVADDLVASLLEELGEPLPATVDPKRVERAG